MAEVTIKALRNGPYMVTGPVRVVDHDGNEFRVSGDKGVFLCRCGQSAHRPFCDGRHKECGFAAAETAA